MGYEVAVGGKERQKHFRTVRAFGRAQDPLTGLRVIDFFNVTPFASIRYIAAPTKIAQSTVLNHLKGWSYTVWYLMWVSHQITTAIMEQQIELSRELCVRLGSAKHCGWTHFLTGYESWFWLTIDYAQQWLPPGAERSTRLKKMISSSKPMIIIFWLPLGFPVVQALPSRVTFTSEFFVDAVLLHIATTKPAGGPGRQLVLHMDSTSAHRARLTAGDLEENRITASHHPAFSPYLAPSEEPTHWPHL
jgi:hypothetical protein